MCGLRSASSGRRRATRATRSATGSAPATSPISSATSCGQASTIWASRASGGGITAGESSGEHYQRDQFPYHGAYCGDVDLTGWRKPISHYRDMLWNRDAAPTLYMAVKEPNGYGGKGDIKETQWSVWPTWESWNWPGWEGRTIDVEVCSKAPAVRLYLNGRLVGEKPTTLATEFKAVFPVAYAAGQLRAVAVDAAGRETDSVLLATAGAPATVRLTADRTAMPADGQSLAYVTAEVIDAEGRVVPNASLPLTVRVDGPARLLAAGSADLEDLEPLTSNRATTWKGLASIVVRSRQKRGSATISVASSLGTHAITLPVR